MSKIYCTYLTIYSGNKLPPFYIGYKDLESINNGYHGSVKSKIYKDIWLKELSDNPHLFKTKILTSHKTKEEAKSKETYLQRSFQVHKNPMYINRHISGENFYGPIMTDEIKAKISSSKTGKKHSQETKEKIRLSRLNNKQKYTPKSRLRPKPKCKICSKQINTGKYYCSYECSKIGTSKPFTTEEIYNIWLKNNKNFSKTGKILGISDNGVKGRLRKASLL